MNIQDLNTPTYVIDVDDTSDSVTLPALASATTLIIYNDSTNPAYVVGGNGADAPTAVFPTSTTQQNGKVIPSKSMVSFTVVSGTKYISAIQLAAGTGSLYISYGEGG